MLVFRHARLLLPDRTSAPGWLAADGGEVVALGEGEPPAAFADAEAIEADGLLLAPGLVDTHLHGALGRDFMEADPVAWETILRHHLAGGTTSVRPTSLTAPPSEIQAFLDVARTFRLRDDSTLPRVLPAHLEGPFLSREKAGAHQADAMLRPTPENVAPFLARAEDIGIMTIAPELPGAPAAIRALCAAGITVSAGHSDADETEAQAGWDAGATRATHLFNAMSAARRRGPWRVAGLVESALGEDRVAGELIADGRHVSPALLRLAWRAKGPDRIVLVSDATAACGMPEGTEFDLAGRRGVVREGAALLTDGSALAGSAIRLLDAVRHLVGTLAVPLHAAWAAASANPAAPLALGALRRGWAADLVLLTPECEVRGVWRAGRRTPCAT